MSFVICLVSGGTCIWYLKREDLFYDWFNINLSFSSRKKKIVIYRSWNEIIHKIGK